MDSSGGVVTPGGSSSSGSPVTGSDGSGGTCAEAARCAGRCPGACTAFCADLPNCVSPCVARCEHECDDICPIPHCIESCNTLCDLECGLTCNLTADPPGCKASCELQCPGRCEATCASAPIDGNSIPRPGAPQPVTPRWGGCALTDAPDGDAALIALALAGLAMRRRARRGVLPGARGV
ncbi:MAG: hypothetical protein QM820_35790 [Minicystis sp.]